jgi:hypothetical protein
LRVNLADATHQLGETRFAESLLNGVVRSVEDWAKPSFHRAGHHASLMHLAAHRKNSALAFDRLVDLTESNARCRVSETDTALASDRQDPRGGRAGDERDRVGKAAREDRSTRDREGHFVKDLRSMNVARRRLMIEPAHQHLSIMRQCALVSISRSVQMELSER